jgi:Trypsin-like peptidase domain
MALIGLVTRRGRDRDGQARSVRRTAAAGVVLVVVAAVVGTKAVGIWSSGRAVSDDQMAVASTVSIRGFGCGLVPRGGAGVVVAEGLVMTDAHVVAGSARLEVTVGTRLTSATVVHLDPKLDLALLQLNPTFGSIRGLIVPIGSAAKGDVGSVAIIRNDRLQSLRITVLRPVSITTEDIYVQGQVTRAGYELQATTRPGDSGAPVIVRGHVTGLLWSRSQLSDTRAWATNPSPLVPQLGSPRLRSIPADTRCR